MDPHLASSQVEPRPAILQTQTTALGPIQSVTLQEVGPPGDMHVVAFAHGSIEAKVRTDSAGKIVKDALPPTETQRKTAFAASDLDGDGKLDKAGLSPSAVRVRKSGQAASSVCRARYRQGWFRFDQGVRQAGLTLRGSITTACH